jgi:hypothetical protein
MPDRDGIGIRARFLWVGISPPVTVVPSTGIEAWSQIQILSQRFINKPPTRPTTTASTMVTG